MHCIHADHPASEHYTISTCNFNGVTGEEFSAHLDDAGVKQRGVPSRERTPCTVVDDDRARHLRGEGDPQLAGGELAFAG